jgi:hypothetical protein
MPTAIVNPRWLIAKGRRISAHRLGAFNVRVDDGAWMRCDVGLAAEGVHVSGRRCAEMLIRYGDIESLTCRETFVLGQQDGMRLTLDDGSTIRFQEIGHTQVASRLAHAIGGHDRRLRLAKMRQAENTAP